MQEAGSSTQAFTLVITSHSTTICTVPLHAGLITWASLLVLITIYQIFKPGGFLTSVNSRETFSIHCKRCSGLDYKPLRCT